MQAQTIVWIAFFLTHGATAVGYADESAPAASQSPQPKTPKARSVPIGLPDADPRLESILSDWEKATSRIRRRDFTFQRIRYDSIFDRELRGTGSLALDMDGRAAYRIVPAAIEAGQVSRRIGYEKAPYELKAEDCQRWHWTGKSVIRVDENDRTFEEIAFPADLAINSVVAPHNFADDEFQPDPPPLPEVDQPSTDLTQSGDPPFDNDVSQCSAPKPLSQKPEPVRKTNKTTISGWFAGVLVAVVLVSALSQVDPAVWSQTPLFPIPRDFLLGTRADELKKQFRIKLLKENDSEAFLQFEPRREQSPFTRAIVILNTGDDKPVAIKAIKLIDNIGGETVHIFSHVQNTLLGHVAPVPPLDRPNLKGYRRISPNTR